MDSHSCTIIGQGGIKMRIFYSQPFHGRTQKAIFTERIIVQRYLSTKFNHVDIIDQYHQVKPDNVESKLWYLSNDLVLMDSADLVVFSPDWEKAKGCLVERGVCDIYEIPYMELDKDDIPGWGLDDVDGT